MASMRSCQRQRKDSTLSNKDLLAYVYGFQARRNPYALERSILHRLCSCLSRVLFSITSWLDFELRLKYLVPGSTTHDVTEIRTEV